ncbi:MAG: hypothetical protein J6Y92_00555 [Lentisphaeria bacterium]|nr:hypothetical protein [Lentisphaeria bacterium]
MSNTKTGRSIVFAIVAVILCCILAIIAGIACMFGRGDKGYHPDPDSWIGLSREDFLDLAFREFPSCRRGGLHTWAWNIDDKGNEGSYSSHSFRTPEEAKADSEFMKYNCWMADIQIMSFLSSFSFPRKKESVVLYFVEGKVVKTEMRYPLNE